MPTRGQMDGLAPPPPLPSSFPSLYSDHITIGARTNAKLDKICTALEN